MHDPVAVALERRAVVGVGLLGARAAAGYERVASGESHSSSSRSIRSLNAVRASCAIRRSILAPHSVDGVKAAARMYSWYRRKPWAKSGLQRASSVE